MKKDQPLFFGIDLLERFPKSFWILWTGFLVLKIALTFITPLSADEAYYWVWSQHLQLGYFDHPPFVSWLWKVGSIFGTHSLAAKIPAIFLFHLSLLFFISAFKQAFSEISEKMFLVLLMAHPMTGLGGLLLTPDLPMFIFWFLSFYLLAKIILQLSVGKSSKEMNLQFALLGLTLGLGFCSKYMIVLFAAHLILWLVFYFFWQRSLLRLIHPRSVLILMFFGILGSMPVLYWNWQNGWTSFQFQLDHGFGGQTFELRWTLDYVFGTLILSLPFIIALFKSKISQMKPLLVFVLISCVFPFFFFLKSTFHGPVELNWPNMIFPFLIGLSCIVWKQRTAFIAYIALMGVLTLGIYVALLGFPHLLKGRLSHEFVAMRERSSLAIKYEPLWTCDYQSASVFSFYSKKKVYKLPGCSRFDFYDTKKEFEVPAGVKKFFVYRFNEQPLPDKYKVTHTWLHEEFENGFYLEEVQIQ